MLQLLLQKRIVYGKLLFCANGNKLNQRQRYYLCHIYIIRLKGSQSNAKQSLHQLNIFRVLCSNVFITYFSDINEVLHVVGQYKVSPEEREIYFFRDGSVVFWNVNSLERKNVLTFLQKYSIGKLVDKVTMEEQSESLPYTYDEQVLLSDFY